jgi:hypothetical protein
MISELEGAERTSSGFRSWLIPAALGIACVAAVAGSARETEPQPAATAQTAPRQASLLDAITSRGDARSLPPPLAFPPEVAHLVARSPFSNTTGLIPLGELEHPGWRFSYRLADGRSLLLMQIPSDVITIDPVAGPALRGPAQVRGYAGEAAFADPSASVAWTEGPVRYTLFSTRVQIEELVRLANTLR